MNYILIGFLEMASSALVVVLITKFVVDMIQSIKKKKRKGIIASIIGLIVCVAFIHLMRAGLFEEIGKAYEKYDKKNIINTNVNIDVNEYLPFVEDTKIVKLDHESSLKLEDNLPIVDGAAAVFPVYSAFVNAVYPSTVTFGSEPFVYNNTVAGYSALAQKETDIFFGAYPSEEQIEYAESLGTEFEFTEIGKEAFVFFVNKKNPVNDLSTSQIKGIYSGKYTNWYDVGGKGIGIIAYQRNEGSGSQSMLERFMGDTAIMNPPREQTDDFMSGIIGKVADYKNSQSSIGFSFRYYLNTLINNPKVKMLSVDGVAPTVENITNGTYPIITPLYAVTYKGNTNENVQKLIDWILSEEGQEIIERTGYAPVK